MTAHDDLAGFYEKSVRRVILEYMTISAELKSQHASTRRNVLRTLHDAASPASTRLEAWANYQIVIETAIDHLADGPRQWAQVAIILEKAVMKAEVGYRHAALLELVDAQTYFRGLLSEWDVVIADLLDVPEYSGLLAEAECSYEPEPDWSNAFNEYLVLISQGSRLTRLEIARLHLGLAVVSDTMVREGQDRERARTQLAISIQAATSGLEGLLEAAEVRRLHADAVGDGVLLA